MDDRTGGSASRPPADLADAARRLKAIVVGSSGNLVEWYDFYIYSAFALYFAGAFFPTGSQTAQLLNTAAIFAVGFLMRPIGGWPFGHFADRHGRRLSLTVSVLLMCFGSLMIAVMPTYETIGIAAPVVLLIARLVQGLSLGGEYGTSATYLSEMAHPDHRGFYSSFQYVTLIGASSSPCWSYWCCRSCC
jgi:MHS family alpha-ketoglutarate permease-like MFS transporter